MATLFVDDVHKISWGWYSGNERRMHLTALGSPAAFPFRVWLEDRGTRIFALDGRLRDGRHIVGYDKRRARQILENLKTFLDGSGRETTERAWVRYLLQRGRLRVSLEGATVVVRVHPRTPDTRTIRISVSAIARVATGQAFLKATRLEWVDHVVAVSGNRVRPRLDERGPSLLVGFVSPKRAKRSIACVVLSVTDIVLGDEAVGIWSPALDQLLFENDPKLAALLRRRMKGPSIPQEEVDRHFAALDAEEKKLGSEMTRAEKHRFLAQISSARPTEAEKSAQATPGKRRRRKPARPEAAARR